MPELPEIETIMRGLAPHLTNISIEDVCIRQAMLRWAIPTTFQDKIQGQKILHLSRRGKYLLVHLTEGTIIIHLGMSGSLQIVSSAKAPSRHDHVDFYLSNETVLRYNDPRRFGAILISETSPLEHPLLKKLGVEPLSDVFDAVFLQNLILNRKTPIKALLMDSKFIVGIGNIYAAESLFLAHLHPLTEAKNLSLKQCTTLVQAIKEILAQAISQGGSTIKDFVNFEGKPGYFAQKLKVYGRAGKACLYCASPLVSILIRQRATVFCPRCQEKH